MSVRTEVKFHGSPMPLEGEHEVTVLRTTIRHGTLPHELVLTHLVQLVWPPVKTPHEVELEWQVHPEAMGR